MRRRTLLRTFPLLAAVLLLTESPLTGAGTADGGSQGLATVQVAGWEISPQRVARDYDVREFRWSPDGGRLLIYGIRSADGERFESLAELEVATSAVRPLREFPVGERRRTPRFEWLPGGRHFLVNRNFWDDLQEPVDALIRIEAANGRTVVSPHRFDAQGEWRLLRGADRFVAVSGSELIAAPLPGGEPGAAEAVRLPIAEIFPGAERVRGLFPLDGRRVLLHVAGAEPHSRERRSEGIVEWDTLPPRRPPAPVAMPVAAPVGPYIWTTSVTGRRIMVATGTAASLDIAAVDLASGAMTRPLPRLDARTISGISWSNEGRKVMVSAVGRLWMGDLQAGTWHEIVLPQAPGALPVYLIKPAWSPDDRWLVGTLQPSGIHPPPAPLLPGQPPPPPQPAPDYYNAPFLVDTTAGLGFPTTVLPMGTLQLAWAPDGRRLATARGSLVLWHFGARVSP